MVKSSKKQNNIGKICYIGNFSIDKVGGLEVANIFIQDSAFSANPKEVIQNTRTEALYEVFLYGDKGCGVYQKISLKALENEILDIDFKAGDELVIIGLAQEVKKESQVIKASDENIFTGKDLQTVLTKTLNGLVNGSVEKENAQTICNVTKTYLDVVKTQLQVQKETHVICDNLETFLEGEK